MQSSGDIVSIWVNPQPDKTASPTNYSATATVTMASSYQLASTTALTMQVSGSATQTFDEIRLGATYASVAPDPLVDLPAAPAATDAMKEANRPVLPAFVISSPAPLGSLTQDAPEPAAAAVVPSARASLPVPAASQSVVAPIGGMRFHPASTGLHTASQVNAFDDLLGNLLDSLTPLNLNN